MTRRRWGSTRPLYGVRLAQWQRSGSRSGCEVYGGRVGRGMSIGRIACSAGRRAASPSYVRPRGRRTRIADRRHTFRLFVPRLGAHFASRLVACVRVCESATACRTGIPYYVCERVERKSFVEFVRVRLYRKIRNRDVRLSGPDVSCSVSFLPKYVLRTEPVAAGRVRVAIYDSVHGLLG